MIENHDELITQNMRLVYYIISREYPTHLHDDDIIQCGMLGLCKAAERWDETRGTFANYAGQWIRGEIKREFVRRKKYKGELSLEYEYDDELTMSDLIVGESDIGYVDDGFYQNLLPEEQKVFDLSNKGYSSDEIASICAIGRQKVRKILRVIRLKWKKLNS